MYRLNNQQGDEAALGNMTSDDDNVRDSKKLIENYLQIFEASLNEEIFAGSYTLKSKLPWKADSLRELLFHRVTDLAKCAYSLLENDHRVAGILLVRALLETTAMAHFLLERTTTFLDNENEVDFDEFLMRALMGSRDETTDLTHR